MAFSGHQLPELGHSGSTHLILLSVHGVSVGQPIPWIKGVGKEQDSSLENQRLVAGTSVRTVGEGLSLSACCSAGRYKP